MGEWWLVMGWIIATISLLTIIVLCYLEGLRVERTRAREERERIRQEWAPTVAPTRAREERERIRQEWAPTPAPTPAPPVAPSWDSDIDALVAPIIEQVYRRGFSDATRALSATVDDAPTEPIPTIVTARERARERYADDIAPGVDHDEVDPWAHLRDENGMVPASIALSGEYSRYVGEARDEPDDDGGWPTGAYGT